MSEGLFTRNARRAAATECSRGHPFTPENTYVSSSGSRGCLACKTETTKAWRAQRRKDRAQTIAHGRTFSRELRDLLIEHIDGPIPFQRSSALRVNRILAAKKAGLLAYDRPERPHRTSLTDQGRAALAEALADWAHALVRARKFRAAQVERLMELPFPAAEPESPGGNIAPERSLQPLGITV